MRSFHFAKSRHGRRKAELVGVGGVDATDQRLCHTVQCLGAKAPAHEGTEAFVVVLAAREKNLARHAQFAAPGKKRRLHEGPQTRRREQEKAFGKRLKLAAMNDVNFLVSRLGRDQAGSQAEAITETKRPGLFRDEGVRAGFDDKIADALGGDGAAEPRAKLPAARRQAQSFFIR